MAPRGAQYERAAGPVFDARPEARADPLNHRREPLAVLRLRMMQPHLPGLHGHHLQGSERARVRVERREEQQAQVVPVLVVAGDAFVVADAVAAAVEDELDRLLALGARQVDVGQGTRTGTSWPIQRATSSACAVPDAARRKLSRV